MPHAPGPDPSRGHGDTQYDVPTSGTDIEPRLENEDIPTFPITLKFVESLEYEVTANEEEHTDQCGYTERDRNGDSGVSIHMMGVITKSNAEALKEARNRGASLGITSELHTEAHSPPESPGLILSDLTITQHHDRNDVEWNVNGENRQETAFTFNLQLGASDSDQ